MSPWRKSRGALAWGSAAVLGAALVLAACDGARPITARLRAALQSALTDTSPGQVSCGGSNAHDRHTGGTFTCQTCHPCGGIFGVQSAAPLPDGKAVTGTITPSTSTSPATCAVTCHNLGANPNVGPVAWNAPAPLACSSCHVQGQNGSVPYRSSHPLDTSSTLANRAACQTCHSTANHPSGTVYLVGTNGTPVPVTSSNVGSVNSVCRSCHDGQGQQLAGQTPPLLVGYDTTTAGDFHGARAGTGFGGTLAAPYVVGQGPLSCPTCHDAHQSTNAFLFAATVNGATVTPAVIDRAGVGAETLCQACHLGNRHAGCMVSGCHDGVTIVRNQVMSLDPAPAGKPCFFCHGHEGIVNFVMPTWDGHPNGTGNFCSHCHSPGWFPPVNYVPPAVVNVTVSGVTPNSAIVTWGTNTLATSYVEYGTTAPGIVAGDYNPVTTHQVTLTGLAPSTAYVYRVRSSDQFRNVTESAQASFSTTSAAAPPPPALVAVADLQAFANTTPVGFGWSAVASPAGNAVQYDLQISTSATFATLTYDSGWIAATNATVNLASPVGSTRYYWRVQARDAVLLAPSAWSAVSSFILYQIDPYAG